MRLATAAGVPVTEMLQLMPCASLSACLTFSMAASTACRVPGSVGRWLLIDSRPCRMIGLPNPKLTQALTASPHQPDGAAAARVRGRRHEPRRERLREPHRL